MRFVSIVRSRLYSYFIIILLFVVFPLFVIVYRQIFGSYEDVLPHYYNPYQYEQFCREVDQLSDPAQISNSPTQLDPRNGIIPYSYSQWRSTPLMPRLLTRCEHAIYMNLLSIVIERIFKKYNIQYMMMAATLLGSYTRHDILPWDDDVDIGVFISDRINLQALIIRELSPEPYSILIMQMHNSRNYDKVFFSWCPLAGKAPWRFPFIDIFYYDQNATHVWLLGETTSCPVLHEEVFPLVLRPLGTLWLYSPREPMAHFDSRKMRQIENGCYAFSYSHKYERLVRDYALHADCSQLKVFYPYVERKCEPYRCTEYLKLGGETIIQQLGYNYAYRTFLYSETNSSYRAC